LVVLVSAVLALVKWDAITRGPTGNEAITVLRVVERELAEARWQHPKRHESIFSRADAALEHAWNKLDEKRYEDVIPAAQAADGLLEGFKN
jgi:hypothetical protein